MAINFPNSPSNGATHTVGNITYVYDSAKGLWKDSPAGLTQGIDDLTDVDISTAAPTNGQILEYNSTSGKFVPADSSAGVTVYATINDLPLTGVTEGSMALVDSTDKLYIFSDTGWYSIAIVNTSPSISGVNTAYTLAMDGTALTISVTASDPEGIPITYSIVSDTSGNIATVAQGTGSNTNQWTITPSTNTAHAGSFTLVFRASDGTNVASASSTFTLAFAFIDSNHTTMLLTSVGANNGVNNSYTDSSASAHTITKYGDTNQVTFSPYRHGGYSVLFDGNDHLSVPANAGFDFGTGDWTIEVWVWLTRHTGSYAPYAGNRYRLITNDTSNPAGKAYVSIGNDHSSDGAGYLCATTGIAAPYDSDFIASNTVPVEQWVHCAFSKASGTLKIYQNGTQVASGSDSQSWDFSDSDGLSIGKAGWNTAEYFHGYMRDLRITKGTGRYTATDESANIPNEPMAADTNTQLLTCHAAYIGDATYTPNVTPISHIVGATGDCKIEPWSPYDNAGYVASNHGGSAYFDDNGDYLSIAASADFNFSSGSWTAEAWVRSESWTESQHVFSLYSDNSNRSSLYYNSSAQKITYWSNGTPRIEGPQLYPHRWYHLALSSNGTTTTMYIDGRAHSSTTTYTQTNANMAVYVGCAWNTAGSPNPSTTSLMHGNISDLRFVKGTAVYTGNFTPPTGPLTQTGGTYPSSTNVNTSITSGHTKLLLPCDDASIIDKSQSIRDIRVVGSLVSSSTQTKFGSTSIKYNGSDARAYLRTGDLFNLGTGEFTVECWLYKDATGTGMILDARPSDTGVPWLLGVSTSEYVFFYDGSSYTASVALSQNTWTHIAVSRDSSNVLRIFLDGTVRHTTNNYTVNLTAADQTVTGVNAGYPSDYISGYIEDLRVTKGKARYTANFTAPTAALGG